MRVHLVAISCHNFVLKKFLSSFIFFEWKGGRCFCGGRFVDGSNFFRLNFFLWFFISLFRSFWIYLYILQNIWTMAWHGLAWFNQTEKDTDVFYILICRSVSLVYFLTWNALEIVLDCCFRGDDDDFLMSFMFWYYIYFFLRSPFSLLIFSHGPPWRCAWFLIWKSGKTIKCSFSSHLRRNKKDCDFNVETWKKTRMRPSFRILKSSSLYHLWSNKKYK